MEALFEIICELIFPLAVWVLQVVYSVLKTLFETVVEIVKDSKKNSKKKRRKKSQQPNQEQARAEQPEQSEYDRPVSQTQRIDENSSSGNARDQRQRIDSGGAAEESPKQTKKTSSSAQKQWKKAQTDSLNYVVPYKLAWTMGMFTIHEGYIGLTKTLGTYSPKTLEPGYHFALPFVTQYLEISTRVNTETIEHVSCGSSTGVVLYFDRVEVVNKLNVKKAYETVKNYSTDYNKLFIRDRVEHELNEFCSRLTVAQISITRFGELDELLAEKLRQNINIWAPAIEILSVRVTKPIVPDALQQQYVELEKIKTEFNILTEKARSQEVSAKAEGERRLAKVQSEYEVALIRFKKQLQEKENQLKIELIESQIELERQKAKSNAEFSSQLKQIEAMSRLLTPEFLRKTGVDCWTSNVTFYNGHNQPQLVLG